MEEAKGSLALLPLSPTKGTHDARVEDPSLGAWGIGMGLVREQEGVLRMRD